MNGKLGAGDGNVLQVASVQSRPELRGFDTQTFEAGEAIFWHGAAGECAFVLQSGRVEIMYGTGDKRRCLGVIKPGGIFGEMALLDDKPHVTDAIAVTRSVCLIVPPLMFRNKLERADPVLRAVVRILTKTVRALAGTPEEAAPAAAVQ